jgi:hypothetical protein
MGGCQSKQNAAAHVTDEIEAQERARSDSAIGETYNNPLAARNKQAAALVLNPIAGGDAGGSDDVVVGVDDASYSWSNALPKTTGAAAAGVAAAVTAAVAMCETKHKADFARVEVEHQENLASVEADHQATQAGTKTQIDALEAEIVGLKAELAAAGNSSGGGDAPRTSSTAAAAAAAADVAAAVTAAIAMCETKHKAECARVEAEHQEKLASVEADHQAKLASALFLRPDHGAGNDAADGPGGEPEVGVGALVPTDPHGENAFDGVVVADYHMATTSPVGGVGASSSSNSGPDVAAAVASAVAKCTAEHESIVAELKKKIKTLEWQHAKQLAAKDDEKLASVEADHQAKLARVEADHQATQDGTKTQIDALEAEIVGLKLNLRLPVSAAVVPMTHTLPLL